MSVKAVILAGGEGSRLRPLTCQTPKPMIPVLEKPVMEYTLNLLKQNHISDISAALCYHASLIRSYFGNGEKFGVHMQYTEENSPRGTAGCLLPLKNQLKDTFVVMSGDALTDVSLQSAIHFHRENHALCTLVLKKTDDPLPYGVVLTDEKGNITRFIEKPTWKNVFSNLVNTGIYILEPEIFDYISSDGMPDFAKDVFPLLLENHQPLLGYETKDYWKDIGSMEDYLTAQKDLLSGLIHLPHPSGIHKTAKVHPSCHIRGLCYIGANAVAEENAVLENTVLFSNSYVHARAQVIDSCLWTDAFAGENAVIHKAVLCDNAKAENESVISEGCAVGHHATVMHGSLLCPRVRIHPFLSTLPQSFVKNSVLQNDFPSLIFKQENIFIADAENICQLLYAVYFQFHPEKVLIGFTDETEALGYFAGGLLGCMGISALQCVCPARPMAQTLTLLTASDIGIFLSGQHATLMNRQGLLPDSLISALQSRLTRCSIPSVFVRQVSPFILPKAEQTYLHTLLPAHPLPSSLSSHFKIFCGSAALLKLCAKALLGAGARYVSMNSLEDISLEEDEIGFILHENGLEALPFTFKTTPSPEETRLLSLLCCLKKGHKKLYDLNLPPCAREMAPVVPADLSPDCLFQKEISRDGILFCAALAPLFNHSTLEELLLQLPKNHVFSRDVPCINPDKGRVLSFLSKTAFPHHLKDGLHIHHPKGQADIVPDSFSPRVRVSVQSADSEFSKDLCDFYANKIESFLSRS